MLGDYVLMDLEFFRNKRVLVTGHTGFKGSWLSEILLKHGAVLCGYSLDPPTDPSLFEILKLHERMQENDVRGDIRDLEKLLRVFADFQPEIVIHLAAQPIVKISYEKPVETYETNVMGTVNLMECVRRTPSVKSVLNVTTDKVYENFEWERGYKEDDRLDGYDPYSNSKSCSELVTHSYKKSFLDETGIAVSTARAGNVIGGGDFAFARIIPDCVRAAEKKETILVRNPYSTRPYQHVLEPLFMYLRIVKAQYEDPSFAGYYNVGPDDDSCLQTGHIVDLFCKAYGEGLSWKDISENGPHEAGFLKLDNSLIKKVFAYEPVWKVETAIEKCAEWAKSTDKIVCTDRQILEFENACKDRQ